MSNVTKICELEASIVCPLELLDKKVLERVEGTGVYFLCILVNYSY